MTSVRVRIASGWLIRKDVNTSTKNKLSAHPLSKCTCKLVRTLYRHRKLNHPPESKIA